VNITTAGDLLRAADTHFERAASARGGGIADIAGTIRQLRRTTRSLTRLLDHTEPGHASITRLHRALATAAGEMAQADAILTGPLNKAPSPRLRALTKAADGLAAAADLIATHTTTDTTGRRVDHSAWAQIMHTQSFTEALTAEASHWADHISTMCTGLARKPALSRSAAATCLASAAESLRIVVNAVVAATADLREDVCHILYTIPATTLPARRPPTESESVADLCEGIAISAARLKAAAFTMPTEADWSEHISAPAWRRATRLAASISELAFQALQAAANEQHPGLRVASDALGAASEGWRQAACAWQSTVTDTGSPESATTVEAEDLMLRLGRLVTTKPAWTPARQTWPSADIPDPDDEHQFTQILGPIHHAIDALTTMAAADLQTITRFACTQRFYTPARLLDPARRQSREYVATSAQQIGLLTNRYQRVVSESTRAADVLDELALRYNASSKPLALARKTLRQGPEAGQYDLAVHQSAHSLKSHRNQVSSEIIVRLSPGDAVVVQFPADRLHHAAPAIAETHRDNATVQSRRDERVASISGSWLDTESHECAPAVTSAPRRTAAQLARIDLPSGPNPPRAASGLAIPRRARGQKANRPRMP
jgi:hypothetical protein